MVPSTHSDLDAPTVRTVRTVDTEEALREVRSYQAAMLARGAGSTSNVPMATIPERRGTTTTQPSTSRRSTMSNNSITGPDSEIASVGDEEDMSGDWESEQSDAESDDDAENQLVLRNSIGAHQWNLTRITDPAATTVDNLLHKFTTLSDSQIQASSLPLHVASRPDTAMGESEGIPETSHDHAEDRPASIDVESHVSSHISDAESESEQEPEIRGRHRPSSSPTKERHQAGHNRASHGHRGYHQRPRHHTERRETQQPQHLPHQSRNHAPHPQRFSHSNSYAPESNPFHPFYQNPLNNPPVGSSYAAPPNWESHFNPPFQPYGHVIHRSLSPLRRRGRSWSPQRATATPPAPPPPLPVNEPTAEEKLKKMEQRAQDERLKKLEGYVQETREQQLQEEARESATAAKEEACERKKRDEEIQASLAELTSRQKEDEAKRMQEQLLAALDARREEAEVKAASERERYLKLETQHKDDIERRVTEALARTKEVFEKEITDLKDMAREAKASARAAMRSKKLAEAESAKRARDAVRKTAEQEKGKLIEDHREALSYSQERLLEVEQAKAVAEALLFEQRATPTRQLRLEDGDRRMELIEAQHGTSEPLANTNFLASSFFQDRKASGFFSKPGRLPARPRTQRPVKGMLSLSSEESEEERRVRETSLLSGKTVVLLPPAENTSESDLLEIRTAIIESGLSPANSLIASKGRRARRGKGITATFRWNSSLPTESQLLLTLKENGWKPVYRRKTGKHLPD